MEAQCIRFHSHYIDAAGNNHAQFVFGPGPLARAREVRGEICFDVKRGVASLENLSEKLGRDEEVAIKRAWRTELKL